MFSASKKGFTLIELLVVIAIIGVLSSVVLASLSSARVKARDSERLTVLKAVETAVELYRSNYDHYPNVAGWSCFDCSNTTHKERDVTSPDAADIAQALSPYLSKIPMDPQFPTAGGYLYTSQNSGKEYCFMVYSDRPENLNNFPARFLNLSRCGSVGSNGSCASPGTMGVTVRSVFIRSSGFNAGSANLVGC